MLKPFTPFPVQQRDAFLVPSGPASDPNSFHLFLVLTDPAKSDKILLANASTVYPKVAHDTSCYLQIGDHPFVINQSYIVYAKARIISKAKFCSMIASSQVIHKPPPISIAVLSKIDVGFQTSPFADPDSRLFFNSFK